MVRILSLLAVTLWAVCCLKTTLLVKTVAFISLKDKKKEDKITRVSENSQANVICAVLWIKELSKGSNPL